MDRQKPSYYSIIPADVRYDERLKPNEKLMYGEITSLASKTGICFASNHYFAHLYHKTNQTITVWITDLKKLGYIHVKTFRKGMTIVERCISIRPVTDTTDVKKNLNNLLRKKRRTSSEKSKQVIKKNLKDNNTSKNNTRVNMNNSGKPNYRKMIIKDLEALMVNINTFVAQDVDDWLKTYDPKLIMKAIHQVGVTNPNPRWVVTNITNQLERGCQTYQSKRHVSYGRQPVKERLPKWAKKGYKPKLHPTSKKLQAQVKKDLARLNHRGDKK